MGRLGLTIRLVLLLSIPLSLTWGCQGGSSGCIILGKNRDVKPSGSGKEPFNLGFEVWKLMRQAALQEPHCGAEKAAVLDAHKDAFIEAINTTLPPDDLKALPEGLKSLFPLIDDGTLPGMTDDIAGLVEGIYSDPEDPDKKALKAFVRLTQARNRAVEPDHLIGFVGRLLKQPDLEEAMLALAQVIRENDGVDDQGQPNGEVDLITDTLSFISSKMTDFALPDLASPMNAGLVGELLNPVTVPPGVDLGPPAWGVRLDSNGNPKVAVDPATGKVYAPFVDADADGIADVNASNEPLDAKGAPVSITAFGTDGPRDESKRALAYDGKPLFDYYDAKRTALAMTALLVGDLIRKDAHKDLRPILNTALGPRVINDNGTPSDPTDDYEHFTATDNPILDMQWGSAEIMRYEQIPRLLRTVGQLSRDKPEIGERILIGIGKMWKAVKDAGAMGSHQEMTDLMDMLENLSPVLDQLFEKPNTSGASTARLLMQVYDGLGPEALELPKEMALTIEYHTLVKTGKCGTGVVDPSKSVKVDFAKPMIHNGVDNRSAFEQGVMLLVAVDGPPLPLIGKSLAEVVIESSAGMDPKQGCDLLNAVLGAASLPVIDWMAIGMLNLLGYDGQYVWDNLQAMEAFAHSGAMEGFIPLAKAFVQRGQTRLLLQILHELNKDLQKDLDNDPSTTSSIRRSEPLMLTLFNGDGGDHFYDLIHTLLQAKVDGGPATAADLFADALEYIVDDDVTVFRRNGTTVSSRMKLLLEPARAMTDRIAASGQFATFDHLMTVLVGVVSQTVVNDNGTPGYAGDDFEQLARPGMVGLVAAFTGYAEKLLDVPLAERHAMIDEQQALITEMLTSKSFSKMVRMLDAVDLSPSSGKLYQMVGAIFTPNPSASEDAFGSLMVIVSQSMQKGMEPEVVGDLTKYFSKVLDPAQGRVLNLIRGTSKILEQDFAKTGVKLAQNLFSQGEDGTKTAPISEFLALMDDLRRIDEETCVVAPEAPILTVEEVEAFLKELVHFLRDDTERGLPKIYQIIKDRKK